MKNLTQGIPHEKTNIVKKTQKQVYKYNYSEETFF
jgi:hypothetical protein